jgi:SHS2 domain-containing protein
LLFFKKYGKNDMVKCYRLIDHTADIAIEVTADDLMSLFLNCGYALFDILYETSGVRSQKSYKIKAKGSTKEELLINFLRELFFKIEIYNVILKEIHIEELTKDEIVATAFGEEYKEDRHKLKKEIKAVTYHNVKIEKKDDKLSVIIVFDT